MLRIRNVYLGSEFFPSRIQIFSIPDPGSAFRIKEFKYFNPKQMVSKKSETIRVVHPGSGSRIRILIFYPSRIPDPVVKKASIPCSGSATPEHSIHESLGCIRYLIWKCTIKTWHLLTLAKMKPSIRYRRYRTAEGVFFSLVLYSNCFICRPSVRLLSTMIKKQTVNCSVPDPDPSVLRPPGSASGSASHKYGPGCGSFPFPIKMVVSGLK